MAETTLVDAATVAAAASCAVEAYHVPSDDGVDFRVECDQEHTVTFYAANADFSAITAAALLADWTRDSVAATTSTDGNLYHIPDVNKSYLACVVTNDSVSSATVTVAAE